MSLDIFKLLQINNNNSYKTQQMKWTLSQQGRTQIQKK